MPAVGQYGAEAMLSALGSLLPAATPVTVLNPDLSTPTLYTDLTGSTAAGSNIVNLDVNGNLLFYAVPGQYKLKISGVLLPSPIIVDPVTASSAFLMDVDFTNRQFGGISGSDWSPAIANALSYLGSHGGGGLSGPPGNYNISQNHKIGNGIDVRMGGGGTGGAAVFTCTTSGAGFSFGDNLNPTTAASGGRSGGFCVDGNNVATNPLFVGVGGYRRFDCVASLNAADTGLVLFGTQNCTFDNVVVSGAANDCLKMDRCGCNVFHNPEFTGFGRYGVWFMSGGGAINQSGALTGDYPLNNVFYGGRSESARSGAQACVRQDAGINNMFSDFTCSDTHVADLVKITQAGSPFSTLLRFRDCYMLGSSGCNAFNIDANCYVLGTGTTTVGNVNNLFYLQSGVNSFSDFDNLILTSVAHSFGGTGNSAYVRVRPRINQPFSGAIGSTIAESYPFYDTLSLVLAGYAQVKT